LEKMLERLASQLAAYDEASLLSLWDKYYREVETFQPTREWEESVIILCLLQAVRWKNQLFNSKWMEQRSADFEPEDEKAPDEANDGGELVSGEQSGEGSGPRGRVIAFPSREKGTS